MSTLREQRFRTRVTGGGRGAAHVVLYSTTRIHHEPGNRWTRRSCLRKALCGSLGAVILGVDAESWDTTTRLPIPPAALADITCRRCRSRYESWLKRGFLATDDRTDERACTHDEHVRSFRDLDGGHRKCLDCGMNLGPADRPATNGDDRG